MKKLRHPAKSRRSGFTLVEIITVIVVMAIIIPAIVLPFIEAARELQQPVILGTMAFLAQGEMEEKVIAFNFQSVAEWTDVAIPGFSGYQSSCAIDSSATFGEVTQGVKVVTVTVTNGGRSLDLVTVKTDWVR